MPKLSSVTALLRERADSPGVRAPALRDSRVSLLLVKALELEVARMVAGSSLEA